MDNTKPLADFYNPNVLVNLGPSHPAMHGTLRVMCRINGEVIEDASCELGYLHRGIEKLGETKTYHQWMVYTDRLNYCSALINNIAYAMTVENVMGIKITDRCMWVRMIMMELSRIIDHLVCLAANILDTGALTCFWLLFRWREEAYTMIESACGMRLTTTYARIGGMSYDIPEDFIPRLFKFCEEFPKTIDEVDQLLTANRIWIDRTRGVGVLTAEQALNFGVTGPTLRASGVDIDLRRDRPYYAYDQVDFDVIVGSYGDAFDRYAIRLNEVRESMHIVRQILDKLPAGDYRIQDKKVTPPPRARIDESMEALIHHFKIFTEGFKVPEGEVYVAIESPRGEIGCYIASDGSATPYRMHVRAPSFVNIQTLPHMMRGGLVADAVAVISSVDPVLGEVDR